MAKTISERLASASVRSRTSDIEQLIVDVKAERDAQAAQHVNYRADALNFKLAEIDREDAAQKAARAERNAAALDSELEALEAMLLERRQSDKTEAVEAQRKEALAERDQLVERIKAEWPLIVEHMTSLFDAIQANDARMKAAGLYDSSAEAVARGCDGLFRFGVNQARRLTEMQVPQLGTFELAWPRPVQSVAAKLADATSLARRQQIEIMAKAAAQPSPFCWYRAKVSNGVGNTYHGKFRTGEIGRGQISNGETDILITPQEAERLSAIVGIKVVKLSKAPVAATTFKHPAAA